jgi:hypothetical protein
MKMEKYRLVQENKGDGDDFLEPTTNCEVRITQQGKPRNYISYAMGLFVRDETFTVLLAYIPVAALSHYVANTYLIILYPTG